MATELVENLKDAKGRKIAATRTCGPATLGEDRVIVVLEIDGQSFELTRKSWARLRDKIQAGFDEFPCIPPEQATRLRDKIQAGFDESPCADDDYIPPEQATRIRVIKDFEGWAIDAANDDGCTCEIWGYYDGELLDKETAIQKAPEFAKAIGRPDLAENVEIEEE